MAAANVSLSSLTVLILIRSSPILAIMMTFLNIGCGYGQDLSISGPPLIVGPMRQVENYSYLENSSARKGFWWENLKYLPISDPPSAPFFTLGGEARLRYEWIENSDFGDGLQDSGGYLLTRVLPYVSFDVPDLNHGVKLLFFTQAEVARNDYDARGPAPVDVEQFGILQSFAQLTLPIGDGSLSLQGGRQVISFGTERLLGSRYGTNLLLSFDGGIARWQNNQWNVASFFLQPVVVDPEPFQDFSTGHRQLWGIYATRQLKDSIPALPKAAADLYYLGYRNDNANFNSGQGRELRHTVGSRFFGTQSMGYGALDWNYEGILQFGSFDSQRGNGEILAWSVGTETGYTFDVATAPRLFLRANIISGDENSKDANLQTFNPLFPKGKYFGELTPIGPYNLINLQGGVSCNISSTVTLTVQGGPYWRESTEDAVYGVGGNIVRSGNSDASYIGSQWEVVGEWKPRRELSFLVSYSQFHAGTFLKETGAAETIHFVALETVLQF